MNLWLTIIGTFLMLMLGCIAFMLVVFSGGGIANSPDRNKAVIAVCNASMFLLPGSCLVAIVAAWVAYAMGAGLHGYWTFALPLLCIIAYCVFLWRVTKS